MELILANTFHKSAAKLTGDEQKAVDLAVMGFTRDRNAPGLNFEALNMREKRFHSIRANRDIRVILLIDGARSTAMYVDHHDRAYDWAKRRKGEVNARTGSMQIVEFEEVVREDIRYVPREVAMPPLFIEEEDDYLLSLGVPPVYLPFVKQVSDEDQLLELAVRLPEEAAEALFALKDGARPDPAPKPAAETDPYATPDAQRRFWIASDEEELQRALDAPWAQWSVFLHPSQRDAVQRNWGGPVRIGGTAGTGKSVVAMHRAARLARESSGGRLLLTTFSEPLARSLGEGMDLLLGADSPARGRVEVAPLHVYAHEVLAGAGEETALADDETVRAWIATSREAHGVEREADFLFSEWKAVVDYWGLKSFRAYRGISRRGRGAPLSPRARQLIWPVFDDVLAHLRDGTFATHGDLSEGAADILTERGTYPFRHVVVDEAQDFGPRELAFVRRLAPEGPHSLFFVGDIGQRVQRWPFAWSEAGIDIRGRGRRLTVNYRTSQQISRFAGRLLPERIDTPEGAEDRRTVSLLTGPDPEIVACADVEEERAALERWLRQLIGRGTGTQEIAILARDPALHERTTVPVLNRLSLSSVSLDDTAWENAIFTGGFGAAKGLEFRAVAVIGCEAGIVPSRAALDAEDGDEARAIAEAREVQRLYVAATRAREHLLITHVGPRSPLLPAQDAEAKPSK